MKWYLGALVIGILGAAWALVKAWPTSDLSTEWIRDKAYDKSGG
jgi:hypothetical protein